MKDNEDIEFEKFKAEMIKIHGKYAVNKALIRMKRDKASMKRWENVSDEDIMQLHKRNVELGLLDSEKFDVELYEMTHLTSKQTGIKDVLIWIGSDLTCSTIIVKVSNVPNKYSNDNFNITMPGLEVIGDINKSLITGKVLNDIKDWIKLNQKVLLDYEKGDIVDTGDFLDMIVKI